MTTPTTPQTTDRELVLTDAPRANVFRARTEPALLRQWFGTQQLAEVAAKL